jgi:hypothetical protein
MSRRYLTLSDTQRAELERARDHEPRAYLREAAAALLKIAAGHVPAGVARSGLLKPRKPETVYRWLDRFERGGLAALVHRPRGHRGFSPRGGSATGGDRPPAPRAVRD